MPQNLLENLLENTIPIMEVPIIAYNSEVGDLQLILNTVRFS